jgi:hypothetical protein
VLATASFLLPNYGKAIADRPRSLWIASPLGPRHGTVPPGGKEYKFGKPYCLMVGKREVPQGQLHITPTHMAVVIKSYESGPHKARLLLAELPK